MTYLPRNDFVLFRIVNKRVVRGLLMPDASAQGQERVVVAVGPKVENLNVGDKVLVIGVVGQDTVPLPSDPSLYLTRESNIALVETDDKEE